MEQNLLLLAQTGFSLVTIIYFGLFVRALKTGIDRTAWSQSKKQRAGAMIVSGLTAWILFVGAWSMSGMMSDFSFFPFNLLPVIGTPLIVVILITASKASGEVLSHVPPATMISLQSFRFFVELLLWALFAASLLPEQMTFEGRNFDIIAGVTAPFAAALAARQKISRTGLIIWNILCLGLLVNIVAIAIMSTPSPLRTFMNEPANTIVASFPISLLPGLLVPLAYTLHFFSLKQLVSGRAAARSLKNA